MSALMDWKNELSLTQTPNLCTCRLVCIGTSLQRREEKKEERKGKYSERFIWSSFKSMLHLRFVLLFAPKGNASIVHACVSVSDRPWFTGWIDLSWNHDVHITQDALSYHTFVLIGLLSASANSLLRSESQGHGASECGRKNCLVSIFLFSRLYSLCTKEIQ